MLKFMMKIQNGHKIFIIAFICVYTIRSPISANEISDISLYNDDLVRKLPSKENFYSITFTKRYTESLEEGNKTNRYSTQNPILYKRSEISAKDTDKERLHIFQIRPVYLKKYKKLRNVNENLFNSNFPLFHHYNHFRHFLNNMPERRSFYFDSFLPTYHRRSRFRDYENGNYRPYFQRIRGDLPIQNKYMDSERYENEEVSGNQVQFVDNRETPPAYKKVSIDSMHLLSSSSTEMAYNSKRYVLRSMLIDENGTFLTPEENVTLISTDISNDFLAQKTIVANESIPRTENYSVGFGFTSEISPLQKTNTSTEKSSYSSVKKQLSYEDSQNSSSKENVPVVLDNDSLDSRKPSENGTNEVHSNKNNQLESDSIKEKIKVVGNDRVYYENGEPPNLNLSWYLYLNCSRERCQFTNSSNETELLNEGWVLHNCTTQGCKEMYPKSESIQRFIGLMLLVFSLCILKIIVFLLAFYYCRQIKLAKNGRDDKSNISWDEERFDFAFRDDKRKKGVDQKENKAKSRGNLAEDATFEFGETEHRANNLDNKVPNNQDDTVVKNIGDSVSPPVGADRLNSKIWNPPIEGVSQCLISPKKNSAILIPNKFAEKISTNQSSVASFKSKKKTLSGIPKLVKRIRSSNPLDIPQQTKEDKKIESPEKSGNQKDGKREKELLLMYLDDDILPSSNIKTAADWEAELDGDYKSLIFDK